MESTDLVKTITGVPNVIGQIYADVASPSAKAIGAALGTVFEFSTSFLLPVKLLNEKFKANFTKRLNEYNAKLQEIPEERRCEVHPQIGTPIVEKLTYTTTDEIADLFTTLLAKASDSTQAKLAHPSFIGIIEQLSTDEANIIKYLKNKNHVEYIDVRADLKNQEGFLDMLPKQTVIPRDVKLMYPANTPSYITNLVRLGILSDQIGMHKVSESGMEEIKSYIGFANIEKQLVPASFKSLSINRGYFSVTPLGKMFINACFK